MRRVMPVLLLGVAAVIPFAAPAPAQVPLPAGFESVWGYDTSITVERDGSLRVVEAIDYDFGSTRRHGIYRTIPYRYAYEPDQKYERVYRIDDVAVQASEGTPADVEVTHEDGDVKIRVGDPDTEITGRHLYAISYRVEGALNGFDDHDELYWNAIGDEWNVTIFDATATVNAPSAVTQVACFSGPTGSTLPCDSAGSDGADARFTEDQLFPHSNFTVVVGFEKGVVPAAALAPILEEKWSLQRAFGFTPLSMGLAGFLAAGVVGLGFVLAGRGRDLRYVGSPVDVAFGSATGTAEGVPLLESDHSPVEFVPPDGIRPGQVGTIVDERADVVDVTATIVDLAVRGYLRIEEIEKAGWFGKPDWRLVRLDKRDDLLPYEAVVLDGLFRDGSPVQLSGLRNKYASRMSEAREELMDDAMEQGWFVHRPDRVRAAWYFLSFVAIVGAVALEVLLVLVTRYALVGVPLVIGALILMVLSGHMPRRTAKGYAVLRRTLGFKEFIETSEARRAEFAERSNLFTEYLPYAVVFGCVDKWTRTFEGLGAQPPDTSAWYVGAHPFTCAGFGEAIEGFAVTSAGTLTSTPAASGSSGFSSGGGGGSSGGGGGGGGGGSW